MCMELLSIRSKGLSLIAIAMSNNSIEIWNESEKVETLLTREQVVAMRFGRYNREDATLGTYTRFFSGDFLEFFLENGDR